jgi:hypothetical protein
VYSASDIASGKVLDYAVEKCIDKDGNQRCTTPFLVKKSTCYNIAWTTDGALSHTTVEVRDAGSDELVYYRDTNGDWTPEKGEVCCILLWLISRLDDANLLIKLVYMDFKPKVFKTGNDTVEYTVKTCE